VQWLLYLLLIVTPNALYFVQTARFPRISDQTASVSLHSLTIVRCSSLGGLLTGSYKECAFVGQGGNFVLQMMKQVLKKFKT